MQERVDGRRPFLWIDEGSGRSFRLQRGEFLVAPVAESETHTVPNGLIHDWVGVGFIPNATLADLFAVVRDYDRYKEIYKPVVVESKTLDCTETLLSGT